MYKELAALYKEYEAKAQALYDESEERLREIDPEGKVVTLLSAITGYNFT